MHVHACLGTHVEVKGQPAGTGSLHHVASKNQTQTLCQAPLPTEPSHWPSSLCLRQGLSLSLDSPWLNYTGWPASFRYLLSLPYQHWGYRHHWTQLYVIVGDANQVLMFLWQALQQPSHLHSSIFWGFLPNKGKKLHSQAVRISKSLHTFLLDNVIGVYGESGIICYW